MKHAPILNVGMMPHDDAVDVGAQDRVVPNAGEIAEGDIAKDHRARGDENVSPEARLASQELFELLCDISHKRNTFIFLDPPENRNVKSSGEFWRRNSPLTECEL